MRLLLTNSHHKLCNYAEPKPLSWAKRGRFFWLFFIQFYLRRITYWAPLGRCWLSCRITYWVPVEMLTWVQDHILSTSGDAYFVAGSHTEHHWKCLVTCRITYWAPLEMLTMCLCLDPRNKRKDGWPGREERGGPRDTEKFSVHWPEYATS